MEFKANLDTIIFYVQNVEKLKLFYTTIFNFKIIEEYQQLWTLLEAGNAKIGLHKIGEQYLDEGKGLLKFHNNTKIVFETGEDINKIRAHLIAQNVLMREIKTFNDYGYWLCDGEDPEGNIFQLKQRK